MIALAPPHKKELANYENWLKKRGFSYKVLAKGESLAGYNALVLCGGPDIGKKPERDEMETSWFNEAYGKIPVLGICRGMQLANVILGGSIHEDLSEKLVKHTSDKKDIAGELPVSESSYHEVISVIENKPFKVNSRHHQGVDTLGNTLKVKYWSKEDMIIEAATGKKSFFVQWHPEREEVYDTRAEKVCSEWLKENVQ
jgi:putative glutamine amidotransferase